MSAVFYSRCWSPLDPGPPPTRAATSSHHVRLKCMYMYMSTTRVCCVSSSVAIIRCPEDTYQHQLLLEQANNLNAVYDSLNYIGTCPWAVNGPVSYLNIHSTAH